MCDIGRIRRIIVNEEKPTTATEVIITSIPIKVRELVRVKRVQRLESKDDRRPDNFSIS